MKLLIILNMVDIYIRLHNFLIEIITSIVIALRSSAFSLVLGTARAAPAAGVVRPGTPPKKPAESAEPAVCCIKSISYDLESAENLRKTCGASAVAPRPGVGRA
jgi:hypothetical protein